MAALVGQLALDSSIVFQDWNYRQPIIPTHYFYLGSGFWSLTCVESTLATEPSLQLHFLFSLFFHSWYELQAMIHSIFSFKITIVNFIIHTLMAECLTHITLLTLVLSADQSFSTVSLFSFSIYFFLLSPLLGHYQLLFFHLTMCFIINQHPILLLYLYFKHLN